MGSGDSFRGGSGDRLLLPAPTLPGSLGGAPLELGDRSLLEAMADYAETLLDDAGWDEPVAIAGSSHGGVIALELAARGRAASVVALAPPWMSVSTGAVYGGLLGMASAGLRLAPYAMSRRWTRAIPHAELVTLRGFPHIPQLRDPDRLARLILEHATA